MNRVRLNLTQTIASYRVTIAAYQEQLRAAKVAGDLDRADLIQLHIDAHCDELAALQQTLGVSAERRMGC